MPPLPLATPPQQQDRFSSTEEPLFACEMCGSDGGRSRRRRGPSGPTTVCNKCGLQWRRQQFKELEQSATVGSDSQHTSLNPSVLLPPVPSMQSTPPALPLVKQYCWLPFGGSGLSLANKTGLLPFIQQQIDFCTARTSQLQMQLARSPPLLCNYFQQQLIDSMIMLQNWQLTYTAVQAMS